MSFSYDRLAYPTVPRAMSHPAHLAAVARMVGVPAAPAGTCRMLEVGCGDGSHLIACAAAMPDAAFVGFDLSSAAIERGRRLVSAAGLANVELTVGDIATWRPDGPEFDYVVADGIYSWVPASVRDSLMALVGRALAPRGLAFVSYNVYPGCYTRRMLWEMLRYHVAGIDDPEKAIDEALRMADFLRVGRDKPPGTTLGLFDRDVESVLTKRDRNILYHDELSPVNDPVYFHRFADHAKRNGLEFVSESLPQSMGITTLAGPVMERIDRFADGDRLKREQYVDFATLRRFRQTVLARAGIRPLSVPDPEAIRGLYLVGTALSGEVELANDAPLTVRMDGNELVVRTPLTKAAMAALGDRQPHRMGFAELLPAALAKLGRSSATAAEESELLADLARAWTAGAVLLKGFRPSYVASISARPTASPLARAQLRDGPVATSLLHASIRFEDAPSRMLVQLLDGTRSIDDLAAELLPLFPAEHRPPPAEFQVGLMRNLSMLAAGGFLVK